jgi:ABC-type oligopeptide transport system substrate-binding subunit
MAARLLLRGVASALGVGLFLTVVPASATGYPAQANVLRISVEQDLSTDPNAGALELDSATCAKLVSYTDREPPAGSRLVPEVATTLPRISRGGRTFTFTIRRGLRFSDGSPVTARSFMHMINRVHRPTELPVRGFFLADIEGALETHEGKAPDVSGAIARGNQLILRRVDRGGEFKELTAGNFVARLAMPLFCALPRELPQTEVDTVPSAGPYYVASHVPNRTVLLRRNPNYGGERRRAFDSILFTIGVDPETTVQRAEEGSVDVVLPSEFPPGAAKRLSAQYRVNRTQFFAKPQVSLRYLALNVARPLFRNNIALRQAVNYALDRRALGRVPGTFAGTPATHYLPLGVAGSRPRHVYPTVRPDLPMAKRLARGQTRGGRAVLYTCNTPICAAQAAVIRRNLAEIGLDVTVNQFPRDVQIQKQSRPGEPYDMASERWVVDYPDPANFIDGLLQPGAPANFSHFSEARYVRRINAASKLVGPARAEAYGSLDLELASRAAPLAALFYDNSRFFVSKRIGCVVYNPASFELNLAALCPR